jgi:GNAT superfamily N-acetyltransferase
MEEAMPPLLIAATTPDDPGFAALRTESLEQHFNMLRRLAENWQSGKNRFNAPGETLLGAFVNHQLVGVCGINSDPFSPQPRAGRIRHLYISERYRRRGIGQQLLVSVITHSSAWFDFLNTHAPAQAWPFYERLGFRPVYDEPRVTHRLFCSL